MDKREIGMKIYDHLLEGVTSTTESVRAGIREFGIKCSSCGREAFERQI